VSKAKASAVKRVKKHHHIAIHTGFFVAVAFLLVFGNRSAVEPEPVAPSYIAGLKESKVAVDDVSSAGVAASIAREANMIVADNVQNLADTLNAQVEFASTADEFVAKPQIVATDVKTKDDITTYVAKEGDTINSIAARFNITSDTVRWANNITGDEVSPGTELTILPISGILHTVTESDSVASIATQYSAVKEQVIAFNDLELGGLVAGTKIVVPNGARVMPPDEPTYFSSVAASSGPASGFAFGSEAIYGGNGYDYGWCTWHAANRRNQIGRPIPRNLGNAITWASIASAAGLGVGETPRTGAVVWHRNIGGWGHVAFVEQMNPDGSALVSDMNYPIWGGVTYRTVPPSEFSQYLFIY